MTLSSIFSFRRLVSMSAPIQTMPTIPTRSSTSDTLITVVR